MAFFVSFDICCFKVYFIRDENCNSCFFLLSICLVNLPPSLCFESLCVLAYKMDPDTAYRWVLTFCSICLSVSLIGAFNPFKFRINIGICELILSFNASWLFCPLVDIDSSLWRYSLPKGKFSG